MKKTIYLAALLSLLALSACTNKEETTTAGTSTQEKQQQDSTTTPTETNSNGHSSSKPQTSDDHSNNGTKDAGSSATNPSGYQNNTQTNVTQKEVIAETKKQISSNLEPKLPKELPLTNAKKHLSAATVSDKQMYRVIFFETDTSIPVNHKKLNIVQIAHPIATVEVRQYNTVQQAQEAVGYMSPKEINTGNPPIQLGSGIKGFPEAGAGNKWLNWHEGRWYLSVHASNIEGNSDYTPLAKQIVSYLEKNSLPAPHQYGSVKADVEASKSATNKVTWQEGKTVYSIFGVTNPIDMLKIATHFDPTANSK
ncbi:hypothetical protein [Bacillus testis]|uniref:hypothetical protein n=1 Tax=Bacillus testis TaxID=1622072 RepID=UPI00067F07D2|nr:hypothetical protein [Bacillus testis]